MNEQERDLFFKYSFDLLGIVGTDGYFKRVNPAFERVLGYTEEELCAKPIADFLHPEDIDKTKTRIQTLAAGSPTIASINRYRCKDGSYKSFSWNTTPMGPLLYSVGRDITDQLRNEEKIRQLNLELEKKNEDLEARIKERMADLMRSEAQVQQLQKMDAIGRLAGGIAHDFNNMLGAMTLYCDLLAEDADDPVAVRQKVEEISAVTSRAAALTRQLLVFSRKQIAQLQVIQLNPLIKQLEKMLERLIGENIKITTKLAEDLHTISVDPSQMEQVILNLVVNAKDALPHGGMVTIETCNVYLDEAFTAAHLSVNPGHYVQLCISDNGEGMKQDIVDKIFEPFFTTKPVGKGTGLGLTTTYGIIKQSQGTIWVYSELGHGTVFKIYLPIADKMAAAIAEAPPRPEISAENRTVLIVEDVQVLRDGFAEMLARKGFQVLTADGGAEALAIFKNYIGPIDLLLTDMVMPGLSGLELAKQARLLRKDIRVLYMSGYTSDVLDHSGAADFSQMDFIQKPFNTSTLLAKVQDVLLRK